MADNYLKKQFKKKDVQRLRNLVQGKYGDKTKRQVGYKKYERQYKEGDVWEENGRKWTIKNGIKQNLTKLDNLKKLVVTPLFCPKCKKQMKKHFDPMYYKIHKRCHDCVVKFETKLRVKGLWKEYEKSIINNDIDAFLKDYDKRSEEILNNYSNTTSYFTEHGDKETWKGGKSKKELKEELDKAREEIKNIKK